MSPYILLPVQAYMWCEKDTEVPQVLPSLIAVPWSTVAKSLDMCVLGLVWENMASWCDAV